MGGLSLSRIVYNGIWLLLALACSTLLEQIAFADKAVLTLQEGVILGAVMLISAMLIDVFSLQDSRSGSVLRQSLIFILAASCILFLLSEVHGLFISHGHLMLTALVFFTFFRALAFVLNAQWRYPAWLSSGVVLLGSGTGARQVEQLIAASKGRFSLSGAIALENSGEWKPGDCGEKLLKARHAGAS